MQTLIGAENTLKNILQTVRNATKVKPFRLLIEGEIGTGKEALAKHIYYLHQKTYTSLIEIDCHQPLDPTMLQTKKDLLVFFKNIEALSSLDQEKLLNVLKENPKNISVIAATDLATIKNKLLNNLYNAELVRVINTIPISLPPLRERITDFKFFTATFIHQANKKYGKNINNITPEAFAKLENHDFPGNISELKLVLSLAVLLETGATIQKENIIIKEHLIDFKQEEPLSFNIYKQEQINNLEKKYIVDMLTKHHGHVGKAAQDAQLLRPAFSRLMAKHNIKAKKFKD